METTTFDLAEFQRRLGEAIAWYRSQAPVSDPEHGLRTAALAPPAGLVTPTERELGDPPRPWTAEANRDYWHRVHQAEPQILRERHHAEPATHAETPRARKRPRLRLQVVGTSQQSVD